ncbi:alpha/beta hydrolase [Streptomyces sp. NBC_00234]|uniref:alpha/beta fold hydrolase n=1 Tax=Streptomyces sp. NBC_00234 TaxID=2903638 RepID=UPI002E2AE7C7|nr:alpha/beta fold hydrolase [Streptomyces sp. NBC_00234]
MTAFVLVHGAWHGSWAWDRVTPLLAQAGARVVTPDLTLDSDVGLHHHVDEVVTAIDAMADHDLVLVGHSYAGLVVRQAADRRRERVAHIVLVEGWAGADGVSMAGLAPDWFMTRIRAAAGDGWSVPAPAPELFGITDPGDARWLGRRLRGQPLRSFTEPTRLSGAVDHIPGTGIHCRPETFPFARFAAEVGYRPVALDGSHDVMLSHPRDLAEILLTVPTSGGDFEGRH